MRVTIVGACTLALSLAGESHPASTQQPVTHALLVGVTAYPSLGKQFQLAGPGNDVALMRDVLLAAPFNADPRGISELVETSAGTKNPRRPTRANIEREFVRLANDVNKGDQVVIYFAGHGSQQPDADGDENDGRDEIFLPADIGKWTGGVGRVQNAITDDDLGTWLAAIRGHGAFVAAIFDACQSTSMTRGSIEVARYVSPAELGIQDSAFTTGPNVSGENAILGLDARGGDMVALYAAQTIEPTPEKVLPEGMGKAGAKVHGLFTYTLVSVLEQAAGRLTYRGLVERVIDQYRAMGRIGPTPAFEGGGLDREVFGQKDFAGVRHLLVGDRRENDVQIRAGSIHGLTLGTILRVYPSNARDGDAPVGHVRLTNVDALSAVAEAVAYEGLAAPAMKLLTPGARAEIASIDYGTDVFKVGFLNDPASPSPPEVAKRIERALAQVAKESNGRTVRAASVADAHWLVRAPRDGPVIVAPASGWRIDPARAQRDEEQAPFMVSDTGSDQLITELTRVLAAIGRVRTLSALASAAETQPSEVKVSVELIRLKDLNDTDPTVVPLEAGQRTLRLGDLIAFRIKNTGTASADVNLLLVDSNYGIQLIHPALNRETDARFPVGDERRTGLMRVTTPVGMEQLVTIAVEASAIPQDFRALEQPPLKRLSQQTRSGATTESPRGLPKSALGQLLDGVVGGRGSTRAPEFVDVRKYSMQLLAWRSEMPTKP